jgi:hypothetical protein
LTNNPSEKPPFLPILGYVLGFMVVMALLALLVVWLVRLF